MSSLLSFYSSHQKLAYFLNISEQRRNQFSFWPSMAEKQKGKTGFFVLAENSPHLEKEPQKRIMRYQELLEKYFAKVQFLGLKTLFYNTDKMINRALGPAIPAEHFIRAY